MRRLVESWIAAEKREHGNSLGQAIARLNERRGMRVTYSRVAEWRRGVYVPSQVVLSQMLFHTLPWALKQVGITVSNTQMRGLEAKLWVTHEKDGKSFVELI